MKAHSEISFYTFLLIETILIIISMFVYLELCTMYTFYYPRRVSAVPHT